MDLLGASGLQFSSGRSPERGAHALTGVLHSQTADGGNGAPTYEHGLDCLPQALSSEAYHVTASILLKQEGKGLAWLAADRSVQAAHASQNPLMIGSNSRIIAHALMEGGHHHAATGAAHSAAERMAADLTEPTPDDLSIYVSLMLRGAIAAADTGSRHNTAALLDEAAEAGRRLSQDANHMWTAFGPNNVLCHRVNVALRLGDAGTAIDYARQVDLDQFPINERKATLLLDTSRAFLTRNRHDKALHILRAAGEIAPEEISGRPAITRVGGDGRPETSYLSPGPPSIVLGTEAERGSR